MGNCLGFFRKWFNEGILTPPPPCLAVPTCFKFLSDNFYCSLVGRIGLPIGERYRAQLMFFAFWLTFIGTILLCVPLASTSHNAGVVKSNYWTFGKVDIKNPDTTFKFYFGLVEYVTECDGNACTGGGQTTTRWSSLDCKNQFNNDEFDDDFVDYCQDCRDATKSTVGTVVTSFITQFPTLATDLQRSIAQGDANCQKFMAIFTGLLGFVTTLAAIGQYQSDCFNDLPPKINGQDVKYTAGPAFYCMVFATFLKAADLIIHLIVPVNQEKAWKPSDGIPGFKTNEVTSNPAQEQEQDA